MDNPSAMAYACAWVAGIAIVASLAALVCELMRDWLEERREMRKMKGRGNRPFNAMRSAILIILCEMILAGCVWWIWRAW